MRQTAILAALLGLCVSATLSALAFAVAHEGDPKILDRQPMYQGPGWRNAQLQQGPGSTLALGPGINFPKNNVTLLSWLTLTDFGVPAGGNGNSCFGYVSPSGREYAIIGLSTGTAFVEITNPANPVIVAQIAGPQSLWRDMKVFQNYCYAISEGGSGIQVMNMANIDNGVVTLVNTINDDATSATHTLALNPQTGYLYRSGGGSNGLRIYNLNTNPAAPQRVGTWSDRYVHEPSVFNFTINNQQREIAFCCGGLNSGYNNTGIYVVDVTNKAAPVQLQYVSYANSYYCHQAWLSPNQQYMYVNDELDDQNLGITSTTRVFSISTAGGTVTVTPAGTFTNGNTAIDHNLYTKGNLIYESNYRSGLRVFSTSNPGTPTAPVEIAYFDTWPEDNNASFNGLWNNYPYFPSGIVIGSDIEKGLFVWWVGTPQLAFVLPDGAPSNVPVGGKLVRVQINEQTAGQLVAGTAKLHYNIGAGWLQTNLVATGGNNFTAVFPAAPCGTNIQWYLSAQSTNGILWQSPEGAPTNVNTATYGNGNVVAFSDDFQTNLGWTIGASGDTATAGIWERADPQGTLAQPEDDHTPAPGTFCYVTGASAGTSVGSFDVDGGKTTLVSPTFNLAGQNSARVSYWRWYSNNQGGAPNADVFTVDISNNNGTSWTNLETVGPAGIEASGGWFFREFTVSNFVTPTSTVRLRFVADDSGTGSVVEAAIDDFQISTPNCSGIAVICSGDGSGTACPCANTGGPGQGCANSLGVGGLLAGSGTPSIANDTLLLTGSNMPATATALYVQSTGIDTGGLGTQLGDGLRCISGSSVRLGVKTNSGGSSAFPGVADPKISVLGNLSAGATRYYHIWYRDNAPGYCTSATYNYSNGLTVTWAP
jgi:choice-of-anchor B domain-containing protein